MRFFASFFRRKEKIWKVLKEGLSEIVREDWRGRRFEELWYCYICRYMDVDGL